jgi:hydrogenase maturation protease
VDEPKILVAGIGNIFLGDDGFGVEVARRLSERDWPAGVSVVDFGIRGYDLAFALVDGCQAAILVDALARGEAPGTLYVLEPDVEGLGELSPAGMAGHGLHPAQVLNLARLFGSLPGRILVVGCEPATLEFDLDTVEEGGMGLSEPVQAAVAGAITLVESLVTKVRAALPRALRT